VDENDRSDYAVGYKKPPRHTQFKPGQSGNRSGRPKQSVGFGEALIRQLRKKVTVTMGNQEMRIPMLEAIAIKHVSKAAGGDPKSTALVLDYLRSDESGRDDKLGELLNEFRSIHASRKPGKRRSIRAMEAGRKKEKPRARELTVPTQQQ
jgi:hypothetical protein